MAEKVVVLDENTRAFDANGRKYIVHESLTVNGYQILEELRVELESGTTAGQMVKNCGKAYKFLQQNNPADAAVTLYNAINVGERISAGKPPVWLYQLTLFVRPEGADLAQWDEAAATGWIEDWNAAGIATESLFFFLNICNNRYTTRFNRGIRTTSLEENPEGGEGEPTAESQKSN